MDQASLYIGVLDLTNWCDIKIPRERYESIQRRVLSNRGVLMSLVCTALSNTPNILYHVTAQNCEKEWLQKLKLPCKIALLTWSQVNPFQWVNLLINAV